MHDEFPYVLAAYTVTWIVLIGYATYLWRMTRRILAEARACE